MNKEWEVGVKEIMDLMLKTLRDSIIKKAEDYCNTMQKNNVDTDALNIALLTQISIMDSINKMMVLKKFGYDNGTILLKNLIEVCVLESRIVFENKD